MCILLKSSSESCMYQVRCQAICLMTWVPIAHGRHDGPTFQLSNPRGQSIYRRLSLLEGSQAEEPLCNTSQIHSDHFKHLDHLASKISKVIHVLSRICSGTTEQYRTCDSDILNVEPNNCRIRIPRSRHVKTLFASFLFELVLAQSIWRFVGNINSHDIQFSQEAQHMPTDQNLSRKRKTNQARWMHVPK